MMDSYDPRRSVRLQMLREARRALYAQIALALIGSVIIVAMFTLFFRSSGVDGCVLAHSGYSFCLARGEGQ